MALQLTGPAIEPFSGGPARGLVVFLHGYGADGNDLIAIGREWARAMPHLAFVAPNAPEPCAGSPAGRQWFPLTFRDPHEYWRGVQGAAPVLDAYLDRALAERSLDASRLALVGFSQGTMMALHVGVRRAQAPAALIGYSGHLAGAEALAGQVKARPPIMLVHGDRDEVIPAQALLLAAAGLAAAEIPVEWHIRRGLGHGIDAEGLRFGASFLRGAFAA